jgi:hypothetical protein
VRRNLNIKGRSKEKSVKREPRQTSAWMEEKGLINGLPQGSSMINYTKSRDKAVEDWLSRSAADLKSAKVLYDNKLWDDCVYHLQQSHEKLTKALLLSIGMMTPKQAMEDLRVQQMLGFLPKHPQAYGHRTTRPLISDLEKAAPFIEAYLTRMKNSGLGPTISDFLEGVRTRRKGLKKLKKKPFGLIKTTEQLEIEVKTAQAFLDAIDQAATTAKEKADKLDSAELVRAATSLAKSLGYKVDTSESVSVEEIKVAVLSKLRLSELAMLSAALGSFLDPLFAVCRYPDQPHDPFDENNPYVKNFMGLHDVIARILKQSCESVCNLSHINKEDS